MKRLLTFTHKYMKINKEYRQDDRTMFRSISFKDSINKIT